MFPHQRWGVLSDRARRGSPEGFLFVATKRNPSDSKEKNALGGLICRGLVLSTRFDINTLQSLNLYETRVLSFSRDGALRRSAYVGN